VSAPPVPPNPANPQRGENLFDRWDLDPSHGPQSITERLRERMEEADPPTAVQLRRAWEELTMHPKRRIAEALSTFPETRPPIGRPPLPRRTSTPTQPSGEETRITHAPVAAAMGAAPHPVSALPPLEHDPLLVMRGKRPLHGENK
jgi:hypothetical protein